MQLYRNNTLSPDNVDWPVYMRRALELARNIISAAPNPRVGCVIVKDGKIAGEGWHAAAGQAHAEVGALQAAGNLSRGATAFVTLEPCAHVGRTGPCADALVLAGVTRVVIAGIDPNPAVAGKGVAKLEAAGIEVVHLVDFESEAVALNRGYFQRRQHGLPWVTCKLAMSLDGRTALANGDSKWITGAASRADVQLLRARSSAVVTGIGTVLADDPALTVRATQLPLSNTELQLNSRALARQPLRVILDSSLRTPPAAQILHQEGQVAIYTRTASGSQEPGKKAYSENVTVKTLSSGDSKVPLRSVLESLATEFECNEILVEAGAILSTAFIQAGLVNELVVYIAPKLLGKDGRALVELSGLNSLSAVIEFEIVDVATIGATIGAMIDSSDQRDIRITLQPRTKSGT